MSRLNDLTGKRFGRLTVIERAENLPNRTNAMWHCVCDCGTEKNCRGAHLTREKILSCGCQGRENSIKAKLKHGDTQGEHSRLYGVWCNMKNRCYNKNVRSYENYGARGITVCDEWQNSFENFKAWAIENGYDYEKPSKYQQIERINNDGDYEPDNCTFATAKQQANNKRRRKEMSINQYTIDGKYITTWPGCGFIERATKRYKRCPISAACRGTRKTAYGYKWEYVNG